MSISHNRLHIKYTRKGTFKGVECVRMTREREREREREKERDLWMANSKAKAATVFSPPDKLDMG